MLPVLLVFFFIRRSEDDDAGLLGRNYFIGTWQIDRGVTITAPITYQLDVYGSCSVSPRFGFTGGQWSYRASTQELLIDTGGLLTYEVLNYSGNRFEALSSSDNRIIFFERIPD